VLVSMVKSFERKLRNNRAFELSLKQLLLVNELTFTFVFVLHGYESIFPIISLVRTDMLSCATYYSSLQ